MSAPTPQIKRQKSVDQLRAYLTEKIDKHLDSLSEEQIAELQKQNDQGKFLASSKIIIAAVRHEVSEHNAKKAVEGAVKEAEEHRDEVEREELTRAYGPEIEEALHVTKVWVNEAPKHLAMVNNVAGAIEELAKYEFIQQSGSGAKVLDSAASFRSKAKQVINHDMYKVEQMYMQLLDAREKKDVEKLAELLPVLPDAARALAGKYYELGEYGKKAVDTAITMMDEKVIKAWVKENPDELSKWLERGLTAAGAGMEIAEEAMADSPAKPFQPIVSAWNLFYEVVVTRQVMALDAKRQVRKKQRENVKGHGADLADEDNLLIAKEVCRQQQADFDRILALVGFLAKEIPGWSIISKVIKSAGHAYYEARVTKARKAAGLDEEPEKTTAEAIKDATDSMLDDLAESLPGAIKTAAEEGIQKAISDGVDGLADMVVEMVIDRIMTALMDYLPIEPAQIVTGEDLRREFSNLQSKTKISRSDDAGSVGKPKVECPTEDSDGRPVDKVMQTWAEKDSDGEFFWVKIGSQVGKLHVESKAFTAVSGMGMSFPEADKRGRAIDEVLRKYEDRNHPGSRLEVRMGDLVGIFYDDERFEGLRPASVASWSGRQISIDGYKEGSQTVKGTWVKCTDAEGADTRYLFVEHGGKREWAEIDNRTASGGFNFFELFEHSKIEKRDITKLEPVR